MNKKQDRPSTVGAPASATYKLAFEQELAEMTVAEFIRWNPRFTEEEARARIAAAKAKVSRLKGEQRGVGAFDTRDVSAAGTPEEPAQQGANPSSVARPLGTS